jgi:hypothetical protein
VAVASKDSDNGKSDDERRRHPRRLVCVPATIEADAEEGQHIVLIRDISVSGAFFLSRLPVDVGETVELMIQLTGDPEGPTKEANGAVVRSEPLTEDRVGLWTCGIAVKFDDSLAGFEEELDRLAQLAEKAGLRG